MIAVLGAGPHGRQIAYELGERARLFDDYLDDYPPCSEARSPWIVGAMWPEVRRKIADNQEGCAWHRGRYIAPSAVIGIEVEIGNHVHILAGAIVSHGCAVGAFTSIATRATLCGEVHVGEGVFIGAGATIGHPLHRGAPHGIDGGIIRIGDGAVIGIGATVTRDVPAGATVHACSK